MDLSIIVINNPQKDPSNDCRQIDSKRKNIKENGKDGGRLQRLLWHMVLIAHTLNTYLKQVENLTLIKNSTHHY